jgi:sialic acid synthase SpsE
MTTHTYVIAEISSNHDTILYRAKDLLYKAKESGADAVKFQMFRADSLSQRRTAPEYWRTYKANEMPDSWLPILKKDADDLGMDFLCTAYDAWGIDTVDPYVDKHKISSFEAQDHTYLARIAQTGKPSILSTGMMTLDQVEDSARVLGTPWAILHCTSAYPAPIDQANLQVISTLKAVGWSSRAGLSDHTPGITCPVAAVALGATVIEKHYTDDRSRVGPDHAVSVEPSEFRTMVTMIREVEQALGDGTKRPQASESEMQKYLASPEEEGNALTWSMTKFVAETKKERRGS